jgi:uncharacterized protein (DUF58 family)
VSAGLVVLGSWKGINLILLLAYGLVALFVVNAAIAWRGPLRLRASRVDTGPVFAGTPAERVVELSNPTDQPLAGGWVREGGAGVRLFWPAGRLGPGETIRLTRPIRLPDRGRIAFEPLLVRGGFPFGLVRFHREWGGPAELVVLPRLGRLHLGHFQRWLERTTRGDGRSRPRAQQIPVAEAAVHGLRPYRAGDSPRLIHWRSSARRGELMVREFEEPMPHHDLLLVVDPGAAGPAAEAAVSLAATVCWEWCRHRADQVALVATSGPAVPGGTGPEHGRRLLETLAELPAGEADGVPPGLTGLAPARAPVLLVTPTPTGRLVDGLRQRAGQRLAVIDATSPPDFYSPPPPPED